MNDLTDKLKKMHEEWQQSYTLALAATQDEQKAKCIAADKFSVQLMEMIPEIVQRLHVPISTIIPTCDALSHPRPTLYSNMRNAKEYMK